MKAGLVVVNSPSPLMDNSNIPMGGSTIKKSMEWDDIHDIVNNMER